MATRSQPNNIYSQDPCRAKFLGIASNDGYAFLPYYLITAGLWQCQSQTLQSQSQSQALQSQSHDSSKPKPRPSKPKPQPQLLNFKATNENFLTFNFLYFCMIYMYIYGYLLYIHLQTTLNRICTLLHIFISTSFICKKITFIFSITLNIIYSYYSIH